MIVLPLACAAAAGVVAVSESAYWSSNAAVARLIGIASANRAVRDLQHDLADAGTTPQQLRDRLDELRTHYPATGDAAALVEQLQVLAVALMARRADPHPADEADRAQLAALRRLADELLEQDRRLAAQGREDLQRTLLASRVGIAALSVLCFVALLFYLRQTAALKAQQLALRQAVQAERDRLDAEVRRRTEELTELSAHLHTAREDERHRLARNLHDELGALLTAAKLDAARIRSRLTGGAPEALERLAHLVQTLNQSIALGRSIVEDLRPSTLGNLGLAATLEILAREFSERSGVQVSCTAAPVNLDPAAELMVYRVVQEAITNISKHAQARHVSVQLTSSEGWVELVVSDDGKGFDTAASRRSAYGLRGMRFRVEAEGGRLDVSSVQGQGTRLVARLPESRAAAPATAGHGAWVAPAVPPAKGASGS
jgi:signal transduction histidine kinase